MGERDRRVHYLKHLFKALESDWTMLLSMIPPMMMASAALAIWYGEAGNQRPGLGRPVDVNVVVAHAPALSWSLASKSPA